MIDLLKRFEEDSLDNDPFANPEHSDDEGAGGDDGGDDDLERRLAAIDLGKCCCCSLVLCCLGTRILNNALQVALPRTIYGQSCFLRSAPVSPVRYKIRTLSWPRLFSQVQTLRKTYLRRGGRLRRVYLRLMVLPHRALHDHRMSWPYRRHC
jgi:hypothetical protein